MSPYHMNASRERMQTYATKVAQHTFQASYGPMLAFGLCQPVLNIGA